MITWMGLLEASAAGGICIVLFFLASMLLGERYRAGYRKAVWLLIALRMCIPVSSLAFPRAVTVEIPVLVLRESSAEKVSGKTGSDFTYQSKSTEDQAKGAAVPAGGKDGQDQAEGRTFPGRLALQDILVLVWACGCAAVLVYYLAVHFVFCRKMMKNSRECTDRNILAAAAGAAEKLGLKNLPQIRLVKEMQTGPFTMGFFRNIVFLPESLCREGTCGALQEPLRGSSDRLEVQEDSLAGAEDTPSVNYIIRHELSHCAGKDTQLKLLLIVVNAIHWFNPLAWFMKSLADQDMELICDERVLGDASREERKEYGEVLLSCIGTDREGRSVLSTGYVQGMKFIKKRFRNIFNTEKKSGKAVACILIALLMAVSGMVGFKAGRTAYAVSSIAIDSGIELRTDVTGDGMDDRVRVYDDTYNLTTSVLLLAGDGREAQFDYDEELWASSYLVSGDLSGNGAADIVVMRISNGMHGEGMVNVLHTAEESGSLKWLEYPGFFIHNAAIDRVQPDTFEDIVCVGAEIIEEAGRHLLRLTALDLEAFDDNTVQYIDCSLQEEGWYIEEMQTVVLVEFSGIGEVSDDGENVVGSQVSDDGENVVGSQASDDGENVVGSQASDDDEDIVGNQPFDDSGNVSGSQQLDGNGNAGTSPFFEERRLLEEIVSAFSVAYFAGDTVSMVQYLTEPYLWDMEVYDKSPENVEISAIKGLDDAEGKEIGDVSVISLEYKEAGDDSYTYLTIQLVKTKEGWEIEFYGLEK